MSWKPCEDTRRCVCSVGPTFRVWQQQIRHVSTCPTGLHSASVMQKWRKAGQTGRLRRSLGFTDTIPRPRLILETSAFLLGQTDAGMSAFCPKRTSLVALYMSALGGKADRAFYQRKMAGVTQANRGGKMPGSSARLYCC